MEIVEDAREEPEERPLIEIVAELLVGLNEDEDDDGEDLVEVSNLGLVGLGSVGISVVLEEEDEKLGERVERDESADGIVRFGLGVSFDGGLGADSEEEEGNLLSLEDPLSLEVGDDGDEGLFRRGRHLVHPHPLEEVVGKSFSESDLRLDLLLMPVLRSGDEFVEDSDGTGRKEERRGTQVSVDFDFEIDSDRVEERTHFSVAFPL